MNSKTTARAFCGSCDQRPQLEEITVEHDALRQTISESENGTDSLMTFIDQWEEKSYEKVRKTAEGMREEVEKLEQQRRNEFCGQVDEMEKPSVRAQQEARVTENNPDSWKSMLEKLKKEFQTISSLNQITKDDKSALIHRSQLSSTSTNLPLNPVVTIHPRLRYTHNYGIYVNPRTFLVTPVWYFYSPTQHSWFWTPYGKYDTWMSVHTVIVTKGFYKNQVPAVVNVEIIEYLRAHNPTPPISILQAAERSEKRILTF